MNVLRKITNVSRIGHAGTLDPNATGLLIVGVGREATKTLGDLTKNTTKEYIAEIILGETKDTYDVCGKSTSVNSTIPSTKEVKTVLKNFTGNQKQTPPKFSAIKVNGKKSYEIARRGGEVILESRDVTIYSIKLIEYKYPKLVISTKVSSGTYIRSLANDIGQSLKCGAYLNELERTKVGKYSLKRSVKLSELTSENWESSIQS